MNEIARPPVYLLAGGPGRRSGRDPVLELAIGSAGIERPSIAYVGAASGDDRGFFETIAGYLRLSGAGRVELAPMSSRRAKLERTAAILEASDIILVSGGDVEEGMAVVEERGMAPLLRDLHARGKPFLGISAGSIMLARQWVRWEDEDDDATSSLFPCLGLAPVNCDTHGEREGWGELRTLLRLCPDGALGYGIPTGAALRVHPGGSAEALGAPVSRFARARGAVTRESDLEPASR
jgi:cyanophycinase-like exopeptidase